jgi:hypothetical protein
MEALGGINAVLPASDGSIDSVVTLCSSSIDSVVTLCSNVCVNGFYDRYPWGDFLSPETDRIEAAKHRRFNGKNQLGTLTLELTNESAENIVRILFNLTKETRTLSGLEKFAFEVNSVKCMIFLYAAARRIGISDEEFHRCFPFQWTGVHTSLYARKMFPAVLVKRLLTLCRYYNVSVFPLTSNKLLSCFGRKGGKAAHAKRGHLAMTPEFTGYEACKTLAELGWSENQVRNVLNEDWKGTGVSLYRAYLKTQPQLPLRFINTRYYTTFSCACGYERGVAYGGRAPKNGTEREPVETLGAVKKLKDLAEEGKPPSVSGYAYVPKEEGTDEEKLKQLQKAIGMEDEDQLTGLSYQAINSLTGHRNRGANLWNLGSSGYLACQKLRKLKWTAHSLQGELQSTRATNIFKKFCEYVNVPIAPNNPSGHPFSNYVRRRVYGDKKYSSDEEKQETLRAIFMLQELVRKIEAGEVTPPTGENLE